MRRKALMRVCLKWKINVTQKLLDLCNCDTLQIRYMDFLYLEDALYLKSWFLQCLNTKEKAYKSSQLGFALLISAAVIKKLSTGILAIQFPE